jgi:hypothetical protein
VSIAQDLLPESLALLASGLCELGQGALFIDLGICSQTLP